MKIIANNNELFKKDLPKSFIKTTDVPRSTETGVKLIETGNKPIYLSNTEFEILRKINKNNYKRPDLNEFLKRKGIAFDNGDIHIKRPGEPECLMTTRAEDFGTTSPLGPKKSFSPKSNAVKKI